MMNCKDIENSLPLYQGELLSDAKKHAVEEHLKTCAECAKAHAQLQKSAEVVQGLKEVEPPLWFKQKIMAKVREEAEKKSFVQKWFYPLRIKIPVQIFATIFIVVLAVYIYRTGDEQIKEVMPPAVPTTVMEDKKNQLPTETQEAPAADKTIVRKELAAKKDTRDEKMSTYDVSPGSGAPKTEELKKVLPQENVRAGAANMAAVMKGDAAVVKKEADYTALSEKQAEPAKSMPPSSVELERKKEGYVLGASMKQSRTPEVQSVMPKTSISVHVRDLKSAAGEVEMLLIKYEAKKIVKQMPESKAIITAEFKAQNMKDFIAQLKAIGKVEERGMPVDSAEGDISMVIEILNN